MLQVAVPDGHEWLRVVDPVRTDPIDASHSMENGGRWNPPRYWAALYLNSDRDTARLQVLRLLEGTPFLPDDFADDAFDLVAVMLPNAQTALDVVSEVGVATVGLLASYPATATGVRVPHEECWPVATDAHDSGLDAVWCRSAASVDGTGRELSRWPAGRNAVWDRKRSPHGDWR